MYMCVCVCVCVCVFAYMCLCVLTICVTDIHTIKKANITSDIHKIHPTCLLSVSPPRHRNLDVLGVGVPGDRYDTCTQDIGG